MYILSVTQFNGRLYLDYLPIIYTLGIVLGIYFIIKIIIAIHNSGRDKN